MYFIKQYILMLQTSRVNVPSVVHVCHHHNGDVWKPYVTGNRSHVTMVAVPLLNWWEQSCMDNARRQLNPDLVYITRIWEVALHSTASWILLNSTYMPAYYPKIWNQLSLMAAITCISWFSKCLHLSSPSWWLYSDRATHMYT